MYPTVVQLYPVLWQHVGLCLITDARNESTTQQRHQQQPARPDQEGGPRQGTAYLFVVPESNTLRAFAYITLVFAPIYTQHIHISFSTFGISVYYTPCRSNPSPTIQAFHRLSRSRFYFNLVLVLCVVFHSTDEKWMCSNHFFSFQFYPVYTFIFSIFNIFGLWDSKRSPGGLRFFD